MNSWRFSLDFQEFFLSLGMGKRLTPEEREARIKAYEEAKAAKQAARLEKRKARIEAYEKAKARREREKKGVRPATVNENTVVGKVKSFPTYKGVVEKGDEVGFRFLGMAMAGTVVDISKERNYRIQEEDGDMLEEDKEDKGIITTYYVVKESSEGVFYPIKRNDILAKKINGRWIDSCK